MTTDYSEFLSNKNSRLKFKYKNEGQLSEIE